MQRVRQQREQSDIIHHRRPLRRRLRTRHVHLTPTNEKAAAALRNCRKSIWKTELGRPPDPTSQFPPPLDPVGPHMMMMCSHGSMAAMEIDSVGRRREGGVLSLSPLDGELESPSSQYGR